MTRRGAYRSVEPSEGRPQETATVTEVRKRGDGLYHSQAARRLAGNTLTGLIQSENQEFSGQLPGEIVGAYYLANSARRLKKNKRIRASRETYRDYVDTLKLGDADSASSQMGVSPEIRAKNLKHLKETRPHVYKTLREDLMRGSDAAAVEYTSPRTYRANTGSESIRSNLFRQTAGRLLRGDSHDLGSQMPMEAYSTAETAVVAKNAIGSLAEKQALRAQEKAFIKSTGGTLKRSFQLPSPSLRLAQARRRQLALQRTAAIRNSANRALAAFAHRRIGTGVMAVLEIIRALISALFGAIFTVLLPLILFIIAAFAVVMLIITLLTGNYTIHYSYGNLEGNEALIAQYLMVERGFTPVVTAAIMGNIGGESGFDTASEYQHDRLEDGVFMYERAVGLFQFTHFATYPPHSACDCEYCSYKRWCGATGKNAHSAEAQFEWAFDSGSLWTDRWNDVGLTNTMGDVLERNYYIGDCGVPESYRDRYSTPEEFLQETDVDYATYLWMACYEKCSDLLSHYDTNRLPAARRIYAALSQPSANGAGGMVMDGSLNATQRSIVSSAQVVPSPGVGLCAMWVSQVFARAGYTYPSYDADDFYWQATTSTNKADLKPGMVIAVPSHTHTWAGSIWGHVGIYIGGGQVMDNIGYIRTISLDSWIDYYSTTYQARWGWVYGQALA